MSSLPGSAEHPTAPMTVAIVVLRQRASHPMTGPSGNGRLLNTLRQRLLGAEAAGSRATMEDDGGIDVLMLDAVTGEASASPGDDAFLLRLMDRLRDAVGRPADLPNGVPKIPVAAARGGLAPWQVRRVMRVMADRLADPAGLPAFAAEVGLSASHFCRAFKTAVGVSPHQYLIGLRIEQARQLLAGTAMPVIEVGAAVGYDDPSYFARLFRRSTGVSPAGYRRRIHVEGAVPVSA
jgi:AraC-like DNA-binding protein